MASISGDTTLPQPIFRNQLNQSLQSLSVLESGSDLQAAVGFVRSRAKLTVLAVRDSWTAHGFDVLTDRQRTVARAAYEAGYYDYPRTATQEDIAAIVGVTASTAAEHLRNAEQALIEQAISQ